MQRFLYTWLSLIRVQVAPLSPPSLPRQQDPSRSMWQSWNGVSARPALFLRPEPSALPRPIPRTPPLPGPARGVSEECGASRSGPRRGSHGSKPAGPGRSGREHGRVRRGWAVPSGLAPLAEAKSPVLSKQPWDTEPLTRKTEGRSRSPRAISHPQTAGRLFN